MITATDAKRIYGLNETQLESLPVSLSRSRYHDRIRKYNIDDVRKVAVVIFDTDDPVEINRQRVERRLGHNTVTYPYDFMTLWSTHKSSTYGIKAAYKRFQDFNNMLNDGLIPVAIPVSALITSYVIEKKDIVEQKIREFDLRQALAERGLKLRSDSTLCAMYIDGDGEKTIDEIVSIMENMAFLYKHTNYQNILSKLYRNSHDMDKHSMSYKAQKQAMKQYKGTRDIVPLGLHVFLESNIS